MFQGSLLKKLKYEHLKHLGREMNCWALGKHLERHRSTENTKSLENARNGSLKMVTERNIAKNHMNINGLNLLVQI